VIQFGKFWSIFGLPNNFIVRPRHLHDHRISSSKWLCLRSGVQSALRYYSRPLLPDRFSVVFVRFDTSRSSQSKEEIREEQSLGKLLAVFKPHEYPDTFPP
jgi:hypothetical protein